MLAVDLEELRRQRRPMLISHRDYDPKNAVIDRAGHLVITDWDYAGPVLPGVELIVGATSFAASDDQIIAFVDAYRGAGAEIDDADALAMTSEVADLDWLLRNVEASLHHDSVVSYDTASTLIDSLPADVSRSSSWPTRLAELLTDGPRSGSTHEPSGDRGAESRDA